MSERGDRAGMRVLVTSAYQDPEPITSFRRLIELDRFQIHTLTDDPDDADIILFVENSHYTDDPYFKTLRRHPWVKAYREKAFMYNEHDRPWCVLPGLYFSMPKNRIDLTRQRPCGFVREINPHIAYVEPSRSEPAYLFSFVGRSYPGVRSRILALNCPRAYIRNTSEFRAYAVDDSAGTRTRHLQAFATSLTQSKFVLCPRGVATSSLRPFETMKAGRVPVIVSDQYALPIGPEWERFAVFVSEEDVDELPALLTQHENTWESKAARAREAWEEWFSPEVLFHRMIEDVITVGASRRLPEAFTQRVPQSTYMEWRARAMLRPMRERLRQVKRG